MLLEVTDILKTPIKTIRDTEEIGDGDNECLQQMRDLLSPAYFSQLLLVYSNSGRGMNELGDVGKCTRRCVIYLIKPYSESDLEYITLQIQIVESGFFILRQGICSPKHCNTKEHYSTITKFMEDSFKVLAPTVEIRAIFGKI